MKKIVITMLVLLSAAYAVGIGGGEVARKLNLRPSQIVPAADTLPVRNLIYLIGDGMGLSHVSMLMLEEGYGTTAFDRAQNIALITTYSANNRVTDSAAAGTALATGHKTGNGMLGVLPDSTAAESIMADAIRAGMPTGVVVTSTLQHATPGAFYAHVPYRRQYQRISDQLAGSDLTVAFGGGLKYAETSEREDGVPGIERLRDRGFRVLTDPSQLDTLSRGPVMGFFADGHLPKMSEGRGDYLERAIRKALEILSREAGERDRGFILMVEGSQLICGLTITMPKASWRRCVISTGRLPLRWISPTGILGRSWSLRPITKRAVFRFLRPMSISSTRRPGSSTVSAPADIRRRWCPSICTGQAPNGLTAYWTTRSWPVC